MSHAKLTAPRLRNIVSRGRLFSFLDGVEAVPVTWVSSPAGSGKTTLLASYLQTRRIPHIWYRVDETDNDVAGFFYYMGEAAKSLKKGRSKPLPLLTAEYRAGLPAFTRRYFESFFGRMTPPYAVVLDNYQDAPEQSPLHGVIKDGLALAPEGVRIFIASRCDYPQPFVPLKVGDMLACLGWEEMRFTLDEAREMIALRRSLPEEAVRSIHQRAGGWAAALVLFSEKGPARKDHELVFDYLAVEVFRELPEYMKTFLLKTSLLPSVSPGNARKLTGMEESGEILTNLSSRYFTERYGDEYSYHPLFREFLLTEARKAYKEELTGLAAQAGQILSEAGRAEEAVTILLDAEAYVAALPPILRRAPELLKQGRIGTLEEWVRRLPGDLVAGSPWFSHWLGMGRLMTDPTSARGCFERAFALFDAQGDVSGCLVSAANIINSIVFEWDDGRPLDPWIEWIDRNVGPATRLASPEMEAHVASAMVSALWRRTYCHPNVDVWIERTLKACERVDDVLVRFMAKANVLEYHGNYLHLDQRGLGAEFREAASSKQKQKQIPPLAHLMYMVRPAHLSDWLESSPDEAARLWKGTVKVMRQSLQTAEEWGAYSHIGMIYAAFVLAAFEMNDLDLAGELLGKMDRLVPAGKSAIRVRFSLRKTVYLFRRGRLTEALAEARVCLEAAERTGCPMYETLARLVYAYVLRLIGDPAGAYRQLDRIKGIIGPPHPPDIVHYLVLLTEAILALDKGDRPGCVEALREAFRIGWDKGYAIVLYYWWQPVEMARLCAEALSADIEVEYARQIVRTHRLAPPGPPEALEKWPWPVRIRTLGRFEVEVNGRPLVFNHKVQKKPLALLRAIVTLGGRNVSEEVVQDLLWPEAEGDRAHTSFKFAVFRLRRLLDSDGALEVKGGRVSFSSTCVWIDTWAFDALADRVSRVHGEPAAGEGVDAVNASATLCLDLYHGIFLIDSDEAWTNLCRKRLQDRYVKTIERLAEKFQRAGESDRAMRFLDAARERIAEAVH